MGRWSALVVGTALAGCAAHLDEPATAPATVTPVVVAATAAALRTPVDWDGLDGRVACSATGTWVRLGRAWQLDGEPLPGRIQLVRRGGGAAFAEVSARDDEPGLGPLVEAWSRLHARLAGRGEVRAAVASVRLQDDRLLVTYTEPGRRGAPRYALSARWVRRNGVTCGLFVLTLAPDAPVGQALLQGVQDYPGADLTPTPPARNPAWADTVYLLAQGLCVLGSSPARCGSGPTVP